LPLKLNREHRLPGGLAVLEVAVGASGLTQWIGLVDRNLHRAALDHLEQLASGGQKILSARNVSIQGRPGQEQ
jgi:hypothetical protein